jgi:hypothetical protein
MAVLPGFPLGGLDFPLGALAQGALPPLALIGCSPRTSTLLASLARARGKRWLAGADSISAKNTNGGVALSERSESKAFDGGLLHIPLIIRPHLERFPNLGVLKKHRDRLNHRYDETGGSLSIAFACYVELKESGYWPKGDRYE